MKNKQELFTEDEVVELVKHVLEVAMDSEETPEDHSKKFLTGRRPSFRDLKGGPWENAPKDEEEEDDSKSSTCPVLPPGGGK